MKVLDKMRQWIKLKDNTLQYIMWIHYGNRKRIVIIVIRKNVRRVNIRKNKRPSFFKSVRLLF